ncbi:hypothetical protein FGO68_gene12424 [Halteria grandinella]|uniref:Uncharacterized protein n=1 Tax=Halteria grandinella TaxID=5974 RepID=A0A8J8P637_HALGN|nr:hypothetical protein FGO68_gene12424 [Halteria grandinella]
MAAFVLALTSFTPLIMFNIISQRRNGHITKREYFRKFNTITVGLKDLKLSQEAWHCISLFKWALTIIVLVQMREYPAQQIQILLVTSVAYQAYLIKVQPYDIALENKMCLYNESLVSIVLYFYIIATEYNKVIEMRDYSGYGILAAIGACVLVNLTKFIIEVYFEIRTKLPQIIRKCNNQQKVKKDLDQSSMVEMQTKSGGFGKNTLTGEGIKHLDANDLSDRPNLDYLFNNALKSSFVAAPQVPKVIENEFLQEDPRLETRALFDTLNPLQNLLNQRDVISVRYKPKLISLNPANFNNPASRYRVPKIQNPFDLTFENNSLQFSSTAEQKLKFNSSVESKKPVQLEHDGTCWREI